MPVRCVHFNEPSFEYNFDFPPVSTKKTFKKRKEKKIHLQDFFSCGKSYFFKITPSFPFFQLITYNE